MKRLGVLASAVVALALGGCAADDDAPAGPTPTGPTATGVESTTPSSEPSEAPTSDGPTGATGATGATGETGLVNAENLCEVLDAGELSRASGLRLGDGAFDGAVCVWEAENEAGSLTMSFGTGQNTARYIEELQALDVGEEVEVAGAEAAATVTITSGSGSSRTNRVAVVAKVGHERLTVILIARDANLDRVVEIAEMVTNP
jgi:hypothetical protein